MGKFTLLRGGSRAGGGFLHSGEDNLESQQIRADLGSEGVVAEEQLDEEEPADEHDEVLAGALLVVHARVLGLPAVGPVHVLEQLGALVPGEAVGDELPRRGPEHAGVLGGARLVAEQHLAFPHLEHGVVALDPQVGLGVAVLELDGRVEAQRLPHHGLGQLHPLQRRGGDLAAGLGHGGADLGRQPLVELLPGAGDVGQDPGEEHLEPAVAVERGREQQVVARLLPRQAEALGGVERLRRGGGEVLVQGLVVAADEEGREVEGVEERLLEDHREAERDEGVELPDEPLGRPGRPAAAEVRGRGAHPEVGLADEVEGGGVVELAEVGLAALLGQLRLDGGEERGEVGAEGRDDGVRAGVEQGEEQLLHLAVGGLGRVEVRAHAVAAGEGRGGHVRPREQVLLLHLGHVEEHREALGVQQRHHARVARHARPRRDVDAHHGGAVPLHARLEVLVLPLEVVEVEAVAHRADHRQAVIARHGARGGAGGTVEASTHYAA
jgi:hypothetical protein